MGGRGANVRRPRGWKAQPIQSAESPRRRIFVHLSVPWNDCRASDHYRMCIISWTSVFSSGLHSFTPPAHSLLLSAPPLFPKQQTLPQCVPGGLSRRTRQPSWSLPGAPRSCRLSLVSPWWPRVLPASSLIRAWGGWSVFVCLCKCVR